MSTKQLDWRNAVVFLITALIIYSVWAYTDVLFEGVFDYLFFFFYWNFMLLVMFLLHFFENRNV